MTAPRQLPTELQDPMHGIVISPTVPWVVTADHPIGQPNPLFMVENDAPETGVPEFAQDQQNEVLAALLTGVAALTSELRLICRLFENQGNKSPFLDLEAAAAFLCMPPSTLRRYAERERRIPYHIVGQGNWVFDKEDLIRFMERFRRQGIDG